MITQDESIIMATCDDVAPDEASEIINKLEQELLESPYRGVGLAASQIGILKKAFIIRTGHAGGSWDFINPEIIDYSEPIVFTEEGCLSYPNILLRTLRYNRISIRDSSRLEPITMTGVLAVIAQHEYQHTIGQNMFRNELSKLTDTTLCLCGSQKVFRSCCKPILIKYMRIL